MESQVTNLYRRAVLQPRSSCVSEWLVVIGGVLKKQRKAIVVSWSVVMLSSRGGVVDHG